MSSRNSSSRNSVKMVRDPGVDLGRAARLLGHIGGEREARPVDRRRARSATAAECGSSRIRAGRRKVLFGEHDRYRSLCTGTKVARRQAVPQLRIEAGGRRRRVGHEQHDRLDETPPRLLHEADFGHDLEELVERP